MCFALALWNEQDPIVKERLFGLTNSEGNHGEDVKEYYFFVDNVPTHSFQRWLLQVPAGARTRTTTSSRRTAPGRATSPSTSCSTPAIFDDDRYFDVEVTYAKADPGDLLCRITVSNRGPDDAPIHLLPTLWFRNTWSFPPHTPRPSLTQVAPGRRPRRAPRARHLAPPRARVGDAAVLRQRDEHGPPVGRGRLAAVPEGRHRRPRRARHGDGEPRRHRHQGRRPRPPRRAGRGEHRDVAAPRRGRRPAGAVRRRRRRGRRPAGRGRRVLRRRSRPRPSTRTPPT